MNLYSKIIMPFMALVLTILAFKGKDVWQLGLFFSTFLVLLNLEQIKIFKLGKDGLELERITQEAEKALESLKKFAISVYKPLLQFSVSNGRWNSSLNLIELLKLRQETELVLCWLKVDKNIIEERTWILDNYILFDILHKASGKLSGKDNELQSFIGKEYLKNVREKSFAPDIHGIENSLKSSVIWNDEVKQILDEARYFQKHKAIKTPSLFEKRSLTRLVASE